VYKSCVMRGGYFGEEVRGLTKKADSGWRSAGSQSAKISSPICQNRADVGHPGASPLKPKAGLHGPPGLDSPCCQHQKAIINKLSNNFSG